MAAWTAFPGWKSRFLPEAILKGRTRYATTFLLLVLKATVWEHTAIQRLSDGGRRAYVRSQRVSQLFIALLMLHCAC